MTEHYETTAKTTEESVETTVLKAWNKPTLRVKNAAQRTDGGSSGSGFESSSYASS